MWTVVSSLFEYIEPSRGRIRHWLVLPHFREKAVFCATLLSVLPLSDIFLSILACSVPINSLITRNIYMPFSSQACLWQPYLLDPGLRRGRPMNGRLRLWDSCFPLFVCWHPHRITQYYTNQLIGHPAKPGDQHFCFEGLFFSIFPFKVMIDKTVIIEIKHLYIFIT